MLGKVLIIDDDPGLLTLLRIGLERDDYEVVTAECAEEGLHRAYATHPDAVILDVMMPGTDGWVVCQRLRQVCDSPILFLTARAGTQDLVKGLALGADDYIVKPCKLDELRARLSKALSARARRAPDSCSDIYDDGSLRIDPAAGTASRDGRPVDLTPTESRLLSYLVSQRGRVVPHRELMVHVWGPQYADAVKYLGVYMWYLRQKIERYPSRPCYLLTKHRVGYYFDAPPSGGRRDPEPLTGGHDLL